MNIKEVTYSSIYLFHRYLSMTSLVLGLFQTQRLHPRATQAGRLAITELIFGRGEMYNKENAHMNPTVCQKRSMGRNGPG